ncbi:TetR/AcrR family transcriptional regulator [Neobacillus dielmonensis]|uniref:TetR/AcrR family transcriptional regulator n=1 Tax=Neobacillus dielmonensis TaxID=1347369 RepID=UPI0005AA7568|nr:TetR/AcrR family transcriptional regulator [Neobacillus dielmonensis]
MNNSVKDLDKTSTKYKILETAIELFSRKGFSAVSVRDLTKEVGIKESALYNHFKSKDQILEWIYDLFRELHAKTRPTEEQLRMIVKHTTIQEFLTQGLSNFKQAAADPLHEKMWRILNIEQFRDQRAREIILKDVYYGTIRFLETALQGFMQEQKINQENAAVLAVEYQYPLFAMMTEFLLLRYDGKDTQELEEKMNQHLYYFLSKL